MKKRKRLTLGVIQQAIAENAKSQDFLDSLLKATRSANQCGKTDWSWNEFRDFYEKKMRKK